MSDVYSYAEKYTINSTFKIINRMYKQENTHHKCGINYVSN